MAKKKSIEPVSPKDDSAKEIVEKKLVPVTDLSGNILYWTEV